MKSGYKQHVSNYSLGVLFFIIVGQSGYTIH
jgi:hypothetical protein